MKVILLEKIAKLGNLGDFADVAKGFARNYLIPFKKAKYATEENIKFLNEKKTEMEKQALDQLNEAKKRADEISDIELSLTAKAGDEGKLFGSISANDLAKAATSAGIKIDKKEIKLPKGGPIRSIGEYEVSVQLHPEVKAVIKVIIQSEQNSK